MMPSDYVAKDGSTRSFDLDALFDIVRAHSSKRSGWSSLVVYEPKHAVFIELRSSPPNVHGDSADEAEEITSAEITAHYGIAETTLMQIRKNPKAWRFIDQRKGK